MTVSTNQPTNRPNGFADISLKPPSAAKSVAGQEPSAHVVKTITDLISADTTSRNSNLGLIEAIRDMLKPLGFVSSLTYDTTRMKANLLATLPADNGQQTGGICFSGHVDTVPVDGQDWSSDPFSATIRNGNLYGRGACDMKGFVGTAISVAAARAGSRRASPVHLALSYDEELGCLGVPALVEDMVARDIRPDGCIVGEPTMMGIVCAHKGAHVGRIRIEGLACHSSLAPEGVNAIEHAASVIVHLRALADRFAQDGPFDACFDIPFSTLQTGVIKGGIAVNTVPAECEFTFEFRNLPSVSDERIKKVIERHIEEVAAPAVRRRKATCKVDIDWLAAVPAFAANETASFTSLVRALCDDRSERKVAYGTEAGHFAQAGIPTLVCGPGDISQAHAADEFVSLQQVARCETFLNALLDAPRL
ncbi:MAG: acetylornithine deacetylase [Roseibium sp.]|nr:acetylornithine deacetylase [Roseibium sp.]